MEFNEFGFSSALLEGIDSMGFTEATPIQEQTIPPLLAGRDLLGIAQTGTGKTAAFLLPIMDRIYRGEFSNSELKAIVVVPTRELAIQIDRQVQGFGYFVDVSSIAIYGGTDGIVWEQQMRSLKRGVDIAIATPGRLIDLLNMGDTTIARVRYLVIDEADRMLDMGFYEDIITIRKQLAPDCQIAMFSATMPPKIDQLASKMLRTDAARVEIAISKPPEAICQQAFICFERQKLPLIVHFFQTQEQVKRTVIFVSTKRKALEITPRLKKKGFNVGQMHSDLEQTEREVVMRGFKSGDIDILVATDIVARGIDITDIDLVVNYDMPRDNEDYVHRIGRTARGNDRQGEAITFVTDNELKVFDHLQHFLGREIKRLPLPEELGEAPSYSYNPNSKPLKKRSSSRKNSPKRGRRHPPRSKTNSRKSPKRH